jgi:hypothetical protein
MMKLLLFTVFVGAMQISCQASGQAKTNDDMYSINSDVIEHINPKIAIVDTLIPTVISSKFLREQLEAKVVLNSTQKRRLKKLDASEKGMLIDSAQLSGFKIKSYKPVYQAFRQLSKGHSEYIDKEKPIFLLGKPIVFAAGIAFVDIDLYGGFGAIYILMKKNGKWEIVNEVGKWYS